MKTQYRSHVENKGWTDPVVDGATSGTTGKGLRLEAIQISILEKGGLDLGLEYQAHVQNIGWQDPVDEGQTAGTTGQGLRLEALRILLTGTAATKYDIYYRVHVENYGWQVWYKNGQTAGTEGLALRAEAIEIRIVPIQEQIDKVIPATPIIKSIPTENSLAASYSTHVENKGWGNTVYGGIMSGTVGKGLRMEAIRINIINTGSLNLGVTYQAYIENSGWQTSKSNGATAGTTDQGVRMEAIRIMLTGVDAVKYSVQYRVHIQNQGWAEYKKDWEIAGTTEQALRIEAIEIVITPKGVSLIREPGQVGGVSTEYCTHIENLSWTGWVKNGRKSGTTGRGLRMEGFKLRLATLEAINIGVAYRSHVQNLGWLPWVSNGELSGTEGKGLRLEALEIKLTGADASDYVIQYRVHIENSGWTDWYADGQTAGTIGEALRAEAVSIVIIKKSDLNKNITNEIKNKAPYIQVWGQEYPYPAFLLHDIRTEYRLASSPDFMEGVNSVQSLIFKIDPTHEHYNDLHNLRTNIQVYEIYSNSEKTQIFEGRVLDNAIEFNNIKTVTCEGELSYMLDTTQRPAKYENLTVDEFMTTVLDNHNMSVTADKRIFMGICTVVSTADDALREYTEYKKTFEVIKETVDSLGGYLVIRHIGGLRFLDYLDNFRVVNTQPIEFGKNLLDLNKKEYSDGIITALIPLGAEVGDDDNKQKLTIATVNDNSDYIYDESAVNLYGWIFGTMEFDGITDPSILMQKGYNALHTIVNSIGISVEVSALDLNQINVDIQKINIGDSVRVISKPHGVDLFLPVSKISRSLQEANEGTLTLGGVVPSLTDYVSGTATNIYFGNTAANSVKNIEFITNELMFLVRITNETVEENEERINQAELKITAFGIDMSATETRITNLQTHVDSAEMKITPTAITQTVRSSYEYASDLSGKVSTGNYNGNEIVSRINQTATTISIDASKVNITGLVTFANLATSGQTVINGGNISGGSLNFNNIRASGSLEISDSNGAGLKCASGSHEGSIGSNSSRGLTLATSDTMYMYSQSGGFLQIDMPVFAQKGITISPGYGLSAPNIPTTATSSANRVSSINWRSTYIEVETSSGAKGITVWDSDRKWKTKIVDSTIDALREIAKISARSFSWITDGKSVKCGFIAQEIEATLGEEFVLKVKQADGSSNYQIKEYPFIPLMIKALQELNEKNMRLENEVAILKSKGDTLC